MKPPLKSRPLGIPRADGGASRVNPATYRIEPCEPHVTVRASLEWLTHSAAGSVDLTPAQARRFAEDLLKAARNAEGDRS